MELTKERLEKFWGQVEKGDNCWKWKGGKNGNGYGYFTVDGKPIGAHRISYALSKGALTKGLFILHKCDNPVCVNPDHLSLGTQKENLQDAAKKGRMRSLKRFDTHCQRGHEYTPENTYWRKEGRMCKECHKIRHLCKFIERIPQF